MRKLSIIFILSLLSACGGVKPQLSPQQIALSECKSELSKTKFYKSLSRLGAELQRQEAIVRSGYYDYNKCEFGTPAEKSQINKSVRNASLMGAGGISNNAYLASAMAKAGERKRAELCPPSKQLVGNMAYESGKLEKIKNDFSERKINANKIIESCVASKLPKSATPNNPSEKVNWDAFYNEQGIMTFQCKIVLTRRAVDNNRCSQIKQNDITWPEK